MRILASDGMEKNAVAALRAQGHEVVEQFYEPAELAEQVKNFDVLVVRSATKVRVPIIDAACETGKLKLIIRGGVGIDNIDHKYAEEKGIKVMNTPALPVMLLQSLQWLICFPVLASSALRVTPCAKANGKRRHIRALRFTAKPSASSVSAESDRLSAGWLRAWA